MSLAPGSLPPVSEYVQGRVPGAVFFDFDLVAYDTPGRFASAGMDYARPVILTCGSGLTACILALALHLTGKNDWQVYDGSWDEWGRRADLPVESASVPRGVPS